MNKEPIPGFDVVTIVGVRRTKTLDIGFGRIGHQAYLDLDTEVPNDLGLLVFPDKQRLILGPAAKDKLGNWIKPWGPTTILHASWCFSELRLTPEELVGKTGHFYSWEFPPEVRGDEDLGPVRPN